MIRCPQSAPAPSREDGFTLLEVLVATVIAALALGVLLQGAVGNLRSVQTSGQYQEAVSRARSHLAALSDGSTLVPGENAGDDGRGFRWKTSIVAISSVPIARGNATDVKSGPQVTLYAMNVIISWQSNGNTRQVRLDSERVGPASAATP